MRDAQLPGAVSDLGAIFGAGDLPTVEAVVCDGRAAPLQAKVLVELAGLDEPGRRQVWVERALGRFGSSFERAQWLRDSLPRIAAVTGGVAAAKLARLLMRHVVADRLFAADQAARLVAGSESTVLQLVAAEAAVELAKPWGSPLPKLDLPVARRALALALELVDDETRARVLRRLAGMLPSEERARWLHAASGAAARMTHDAPRGETSSAIAAAWAAIGCEAEAVDVLEHVADPGTRAALLLDIELARRAAPAGSGLVIAGAALPGDPSSPTALGRAASALASLPAGPARDMELVRLARAQARAGLHADAARAASSIAAGGMRGRELALLGIDDGASISDGGRTRLPRQP